MSSTGPAARCDTPHRLTRGGTGKPANHNRRVPTSCVLRLLRNRQSSLNGKSLRLSQKMEMTNRHKLTLNDFKQEVLLFDDGEVCYSVLHRVKRSSSKGAAGHSEVIKNQLLAHLPPSE